MYSSCTMFETIRHQDTRVALAALLLGRLAGDTAEFHRLGGEAALAGLVYDSDPRIRCAHTPACHFAGSSLCSGPSSAASGVFKQQLADPR